MFQVPQKLHSACFNENVQHRLTTSVAPLIKPADRRARLCPTQRSAADTPALVSSTDDGGSAGNGGDEIRRPVNEHDDGAPDGGSWRLRLALAAACAAGLYVSLIGLPPGTSDILDTSNAAVSIIVPALNEERGLGDILDVLAALQPPAHEVIVVDGGSTDRTVQVAKKGGAKVLRAPRGRARQMNAGAAAATGDLLCFLHADTVPPKDLVSILRREFADRRTVLTGFLTSIKVPGRHLWAMTIHHAVKTYYAAFVQPIAFLRGLRGVLGDQAQSCRATDFRRVGGFNNQLAIMEDAELCLSLHHGGPPAAEGGTTSANRPSWLRQRGRVKVIYDRHVVTSGRRLAAWGDLKSTYIHVVLSLAWIFKRDPEEIRRLYQQLYTDAYR